MRRFFHAMVLLCVFATPALAQEGHWYTAIKGGLNGGADAEAASQDVSIGLGTEAGAAVLWSVGYAWEKFRVESELSWRSNDLDTATFPGALRFESTGTNTAPAEGGLTNFAYMLNGAYEMNWTPLFRPFVLAGLGFSSVTAELDRIGTQPFNFDDDKTAFAYQVGAGVEYPLSDSFAMEVSYRFFGTSAVKFSDVDVNNTHHTGLFGLTYAF